MKKQRISVRIAGVELRLMTDQNESEVQQLASEVDTKVMALRQQTEIADTGQLLALALLNQAKEIQMNTEAQREATLQSTIATEDWIEQLSARIEAVL